MYFHRRINIALHQLNRVRKEQNSSASLTVKTVHVGKTLSHHPKSGPQNKY